MIYLIAILIPPLAVLMKGKPVQALLNLVLTLLGYFPGSIHAILVVNKANADKRHNEMIAIIKENTEIKKEAKEI